MAFSRWIKITTLGLLASSSLLWGRFYIGVEGGYLGNEAVYSTEIKTPQKIETEKKLKGNGGFGSLIFGTEHFFGKNYYGIRWGLSAGYGQTKSSDSQWGDITYHSFWAGASFDMLYNFYAIQTFMTGLFTGVEYDFVLLEPKEKIDFGINTKTNTHNLAVRVGLSTLFANHHRLELMAKIPVWMQERSKSVGSSEYEFKYKFFQGLLAYKSVF